MDDPVNTSPAQLWIATCSDTRGSAVEVIDLPPGPVAVPARLRRRAGSRTAGGCCGIGAVWGLSGMGLPVPSFVKGLVRHGPVRQ